MQKAAKELIWRLKSEPVLRNALITLLFALVTVFGINMSEEAKTAVVTVLGAIFALVTRQEVAPMVKVKADGLKKTRS